MAIMMPAFRASPCVPQEVHLGVTEDPTTMRVTWRTQGKDCPTSVLYGLAEEPMLDRETPGIGYHGDFDMLCGDRAAKHKLDLHLHTAVLTGLVPNVQHSYQLPNDPRRFTFTASKPKGDTTPFVFFVAGDMGVTLGNSAKYVGAQIVQSAMLDEIKKGVPDVMLDVGDISYANGNPYIWEAFMNVIEPFTSQFLWVAGVGNHEYDLDETARVDPWGLPPYQPSWGTMQEGDAHGECGLHVYWRFPFGQTFTPVNVHSPNAHLPVPPHGEAFPPFYHAFDQGLVHFVTLSTEHSVEAGSAQIAWLEADLAAVDRCVTPFIVATGHRPLYAPKRDTKDFITGLGLRDHLEDILIRHHVDTYIAGHVHLYYRLCEARNGRCVPPGEGLVSMVIGTAGHEIDPVEREDFDFDDMALESVWGFGKFVVRDHSKMEFSFIEAMTGNVLDTATFHNRGGCVTGA